MPNLVTHYLCGQEAAKNLKNSNCRRLIEKHINVFNLAVQGPDILFYYEVWPWIKKSSDGNIGSKMHTTKVSDVFKAIIDYIVLQKNYARDVLSVYFMGFLCHNCMDSIGHPYIFYRSGFNTPEKNNENLYLCYHRKFETNLDVLLCERYLTKKVHEINCHKLIKIEEPEVFLLGNMYQNVVKKVFNINISKKKFTKAVKEMQAIEWLLRDPHGLKKAVVGFVDKLLYRFPLYSSLIFPLSINDGLDYLNLNHREWAMPHDNTIRSTKSFIDLFNEAHQRTSRLCDELYSAIFENNASIPHTLKLLGNNSYTSGIDCNKPAIFKYSDIIFN